MIAHCSADSFDVGQHLSEYDEVRIATVISVANGEHLVVTGDTSSKEDPAKNGLQTPGKPK
jgi:hypothetical protein